MRIRPKRLARLALITALGVVLLFLASTLPTGRLAMVALSSLPVCVCLMMYGLKWALAVFLLTCILALVLFPSGPVILYAAFFGYYPIVKSAFEKIHTLWKVWVCKFGLYTLVFVLYWLLARSLFPITDGQLSWYILYPAGAVVFALFDQAYSLLIHFYLVKIARYFHD